MEYNSLEDVYIQPPFSILNSSKGSWQNRKRKWIGLGIQSEVGRKDDLLFDCSGDSDMAERMRNSGGGTSIFDPVLCELSYAWFSKKGDHALDPFAGGSVRGVVGGVLERSYTGIDIRQEQVDSNVEQASVICPDANVNYLTGDSNVVLETLENNSFDFGISCPPYADLEVYSDLEGDISNMAYHEFLPVYESIIAKTYDKMKDDTFFVWVIGEVRDKNGNYYNFLGDTINAFMKAGYNYYNEIVLQTPAGSVPMRTSAQFPVGRKVGKNHQNVLVFVKGCGKKATERLGRKTDKHNFNKNELDELF